MPPRDPRDLGFWAKASDRAMPGERRATFGPFTARIARGVTGRANSASLTDDDEAPEALPTVLAWYAAAGRPCIVQRWRTPHQPAADAPGDALAAHGFERGPGAVVYARASDDFARGATGDAVTVSPTPADACADWMGRDRLAEMATPLRTRHAALWDDARPIGRAMAIADDADRLVGVFAVETRPEQRRRGVAGRVMAALVADAVTATGAETVWLQVAPDNLVARRLYERQGFEVVAAYDYWRPGERPQPS